MKRKFAYVATKRVKGVVNCANCVNEDPKQTKRMGFVRRSIVKIKAETGGQDFCSNCSLPLAAR